MIFCARLTIVFFVTTFAQVGLAADGPKSGQNQDKKESTESFSKDIRPLFVKYCIQCHGGSKPKAHLGLDAYKDEKSILKSPDVLDKIQEKIRAREMPPDQKPQPSADERKLLTRWIDAKLANLSQPSGARDPGRVTIRRLNRVEYNNTIRDLVGVDFRPADDFPADDVGYGFDNIGDVLSLPPLLMENYLAAAEKIISEAYKTPELRRRLLPRDNRERGALFQNLKQFASRAWRRPATDEETRRLQRLVQLAREQGDNPMVGIKTALQAVLVSPHFLFRVELDDGKGSQGVDTPRSPQPIRSWELASRLS